MAAEDAVVDMLTSISTKLLIAGTEIGLKITGAGARAIGVSFYALAKAISNKRSQGKTLTPGEVEFEKMMKSGEEIHSIWLKDTDLQNFSEIARQMGIPFVAIKNGDELEKAHGFLHHNKADGNTIEFSDEYKDKVSISYRASDEVRIAHILEMFNTFDKSETEVKETVDKEETVDDVEKFIRESGVKVEYPPEVAALREVKAQNQDRAFATSSTISETTQTNNDAPPLCFSEFGFKKRPSQSEYDAAYIHHLTECGINPSEPNYFTALYEQGTKIISGEITPDKAARLASPNTVADEYARSIWKDKSEAKAEKNVSTDSYKFFGFDEKPSVDALKKRFSDSIAQNGDKDKSAKNAFAAALTEIDASAKSVREKLKAKRELHNLKTSDDGAKKVMQRSQDNIKAR